LKQIQKNYLYSDFRFQLLDTATDSRSSAVGGWVIAIGGRCPAVGGWVIAILRKKTIKQIVKKTAHNSFLF